MAHKDLIIDSDGHFIIDPVTRTITNQSVKTNITQYDHNSERLTFEVDLVVEGHEMSHCNRVEIHFINMSSDKRSQFKDVYVVDDLAITDNVVTFSWLISRNATQLSGQLLFAIHFICKDDSEVVYSLNTSSFTGLTVSEGINNSDTISEDYPDVLKQMMSDLQTHINERLGVIENGSY